MFYLWPVTRTQYRHKTIGLDSIFAFCEQKHISDYNNSFQGRPSPRQPRHNLLLSFPSHSVPILPSPPFQRGSGGITHGKILELKMIVGEFYSILHIHI